MSEKTKQKKISASELTWKRFDEIAADRGLVGSGATFALIVNQAWDEMQKRRKDSKE